jgi:hypothetical protein
MRKQLINTFQNYFQVKLQVLPATKETLQNMEKLLFLEVIRMLQELNDRSEVLAEMGLDLTEYENAYYDLIQNLLRMSFNDAQIELINYYVYQLPDQEDFEGTLELTKGKKTVKKPFNTPEDLWEVLKEVK